MFTSFFRQPTLGHPGGFHARMPESNAVYRMNWWPTLPSRHRFPSVWQSPGASAAYFGSRHASKASRVLFIVILNRRKRVMPNLWRTGYGAVCECAV